MKLFKSNENSLLVYSKNTKIDVLSYLYAKGYIVESIMVYVAPNEIYEAYICTSEYINDEDDARKSALEIMNENIVYECLINYQNYGTYRLRTDGYEEATECKVYELATTYPIYIKESVSYSFPKSERYIDINEKKQLKVGMMVELLNGNTWVEKFIDNIDEDYEKIYKLFIKHKKIRTKSNF